MKTTNVNIGAFIFAWRLAAYGLDGHFNGDRNKPFETIAKKVLSHKYYAVIYDRNDTRCFGIFDTEWERDNWLVEWFDNNPDDDYSGMASYKNFKKHACGDIESVCCYSILKNTSGVMFVNG